LNNPDILENQTDRASFDLTGGGGDPPSGAMGFNRNNRSPEMMLSAEIKRVEGAALKKAKTCALHHILRHEPGLAWLILVIDIREPLTVGIADNKRRANVLD
jgi:hypothetical protein